MTSAAGLREDAGHAKLIKVPTLSRDIQARDLRFPVCACM